MEQTLSTISTANTDYSKLRMRIAVSVFFFCQGICFASWASRIPDIKTTLQLSEAALGSILLALPAGQLTMMPFSGKLVTRFGSKYVLRLAAAGYALTLILIGATTSSWQLALSLYVFGLTGNLCNISVNTQAVNAEHLFGRSILASFHGVWSTAGFTGALVGLLMMRLDLLPVYHFMIVAAIVITLNIFFQKYLIITPTSKSASSFKRFQFPKGLLLQLGLIAFCCLSAEGCMFDWSGVYFKEVVEVKGELVSLGYASFMVMMATGRFTGDKLAERFGRKKMVQLSGVLIFSGMMIAVLLPNIIFATIGFMIVGFGVSSIIPLVYSTAGKVKEVASGIAIATVSGVGFLGFLMGPPLIGYIAELGGLRSSFAVIATLGLMISYMISKIKLA
ncbi:MFS transporter [Lacibacter luteus]|nr:MFS transporter [Lacibacter luteus]